MIRADLLQMVLMLRFGFATPKEMFAGNRVFWRMLHKIRSGVWTVGDLKD